MLTTVPSPGASRAPRSQVGSKHLYAVTCAAVLLLALYTPVSTGIAFGGVQPLRLAVLDFSAASANPLDAPLGKGLQAMLTTDLATIPLIQLVERDRLNDIRDELKLSRGKLIDKATAVRIGKLINASYLLTGTYTVVGARCASTAASLRSGPARSCLPRRWRESATPSSNYKNSSGNRSSVPSSSS